MRNISGKQKLTAPFTGKGRGTGLEAGSLGDGLIDARPVLALSNPVLDGATNAQEMVGRLIGLTEQQEPLPDDVTVLVARCTG